MKKFASPDGIQWTVEIILPGSSNAMIFFRHPDGGSSQQDRYNWVLTQGPEARSVTGRVAPRKVLDNLAEADIAMLYQRSMPVTRTTPTARVEELAGSPTR